MKRLVFVSRKDNIGFEEGAGSYVQFDNTKVGRQSRIQGELRMDYKQIGDGIFWVGQRSIAIKANYTAADDRENKLYDEAEVLTDGETVEIMLIDNASMKIISNNKYRFIVLGDFSDCAIFEQI